MSDAVEAPAVRKHAVAALVHGRYLVADDGAVDPGDGAPLLVGFHGYGENAGRHLAALRRIPGAAAWRLCAVEALHPFYTRSTGEVVGSWMTRRDRERAIEDNLRYAASVIADVKRRYRTGRTLVIAGFSQGVAMAYRTAFGSGHPCQGLLALAGDVPPDVAARGATAAAPRILLGRGTRDEWYSEAKMAVDLETLAAMEATVETCVFEEGHVWAKAYLEAAGAFLKRIAEPA